MPEHPGIPLDYIFQAMLSIFELSLSWFSQLSQQVGVHFGIWGKVGLHLLAVTMLIWFVYQLFRIISFILMRIVIPLAIAALTLFMLFILMS